MLLKRTLAAEKDLVDIYLYTFDKYGKDQAEKYFTGLDKALLRISKSPSLYRERTEFSPPVRICPHGKHIIAYTIHDNVILIIRVLHASMDIEDHLQNSIDK